MILVIDNYDSFTHNLYQYLSELTSEEVRVVRNDRITLEDIDGLAPSRIVISPGPGRPEDAGISVEVIRRFAKRTPILGVCLGHQAIGAAFGGEIVAAREIVHGKTSKITVDGRGLFRSINSPSEFARYHSLAIAEESLPEVLEITARSEDGEIMGVRHRDYPVEGVQFHPESIAGEDGKRVLHNFLNYKREPFEPRIYLTRLLEGKDLTQEEAAGFMEELTDGNLKDAQIAGFLVALNAKGITAAEIAGCASVLQRKRTPLQVSGSVLDTCGTGGDGLGTFNISSLTALVAASCGARVAKHGNRAVSSRSGSADFYKEIGIGIEISPDQAASCLEETGFAFLYAPLYHGAMRFAGPARRALGIKTIMNLLGPLANPAGADVQLLGVFSADYLRIVAEAAVRLGVQKGLVVHGLDGQDEISVCSKTKAVRFDATKNGTDRATPSATDAGRDPEERLAAATFEEFEIDPEELGLRYHDPAALRGGNAEENVAVARRLLAGERDDRVLAALHDSVVINAAAALELASVAPSMKEGVLLAQAALAEGRTADTLTRVIAATGGDAHERTRHAG